jgi:hypothetical protein
VNPGALIGQPVRVVTQRLRRLGLRTRVEFTRTGSRPPGTVLFVRPSGQVAARSSVTVTAAHQYPAGRARGDDPGSAAASRALPGGAGGDQVLRSQVTLNPLPLLFSGPGWAFTRPAESTMVISSSVYEEITPELTVAPVSAQEWKLARG